MRAVIYARVSSTTDRQSTDRQVIDLTDFATKSNYKVVKVFEEHISGAKKNTERPVLLECLEFAESNSIDVVLCSELSRLGRNCDEVLKNVLRCKDTHINLYFQKENLSLFIAEGGVLGRPVGTRKTPEQLSQEYPKVVRELKKGTSIRRTAKLCDVSNSTVKRVKKALGM